MGRKISIVAVIGIAVFIGFLFRTPKNDYKSNGFVKPKFQRIREKFDEMLSYEREGLAMAAYANGELVIDLWGGFAEKNAMRPWEKDTMTVVFSSSKAIGALLIAILVSRGHLRYEEKVVKYWPEFGKHGKENVTVQWIVEHKAGLITFDGELSMEQTHDHRYVSRLIENTKPKWPPGTEVHYHGLTFGWLVDQLVRRGDPKKRGAAQFYREEIQIHMKDKDFWLGLPREQFYRVARLVQPSTLDSIKLMFTSFSYWWLQWQIVMPNSKMTEAAKYPPWLEALSGKMPYNNPMVLEVESTASLGVGSARGLASVLSAIWQENLINDEIWSKISKPVTPEGMFAMLMLGSGYGFMYAPHPVKKNLYTMEHAGFGNQMIIFDPSSKVVLALVRNGLSYDFREMETARSIMEEIIKT